MAKGPCRECFVVSGLIKRCAEPGFRAIATSLWMGVTPGRSGALFALLLLLAIGDMLLTIGASATTRAPALTDLAVGVVGRGGSRYRCRF